MKKILLTVLTLTFVIFLSACGEKYQSIEDFYNKMSAIGELKSNGMVYQVVQKTDSSEKMYKVFIKKNKMRAETIDNTSYSGYSNLVINNGRDCWSYNPYTRIAVIVSDEKDKKNKNPVEFLINWGKNDAGYLDHIYKFGKNAKINDFDCKIIRNIDPIANKTGFEYCINEDLGIAVYLKVPCIKENMQDNTKCETVTAILKAEETNIPDYFFELPSDASVVK